MFGLYGNEGESSNPDDEDGSGSSASSSDTTGTDFSTQSQTSLGASAQDLFKQIDMSTELPKDVSAKTEIISEDEKSARALAKAIADASERSFGEEVHPDTEQKLKHPFSNGLNLQYKGLASQINTMEESN